MMKYINPLLINIKDKPQEFFVGLCVFIVAVIGTSVHHAASTSFALLLIASFFSIGSWRSSWKQLGKEEKWLMTGFIIYALSGVIAFINVQDVNEYVKDLERYMRFLLAIPMYLFLVKYKVNAIKYLFAGAVFSGFYLFYVAYSSYLNNPGAPASGHYHHIIFGSVAMLNVGVMMAILLSTKANALVKAIVVISMLCGFAAAVLSQSRGVWLALPVYVLITLYYSFQRSRAIFISVIAVIAIGATSLWLSPIGDMVNKRVTAGIEEVSDYYTDDKYISSLGTRLAMWSIAVDVFKQHPIVGTGPGDFDEVVRELQQQGEYVGMDVHGSTHNIYMQSLVHAGVIGFIALLLAIFIFPLKLILSSREKNPTIFLTGIVFLSLFAVIGLSESWTLRLPTVSVYIIYLIVIASSIYSTENKTDDGS